MVVWCGWGVFSAGDANRGTDTIFGRAHRRGDAGVVPDSAVRQNRGTDTIFLARVGGGANRVTDTILRREMRVGSTDEQFEGKSLEPRADLRFQRRLCNIIPQRPHGCDRNARCQRTGY